MRYPGGKGASGVVQTIINQQPPHETYIEAFLGGGAVMKAKRPATVNIGIDRDRSVIANFEGAGSRSDLQLICGNAMAWMMLRSIKNEWTGRELLYCDPPYPFSVRRSAAPMYRYEMEDADHLRLIGQLLELPCMVQISGYKCPLYARWLKDWRVIQYQAATRHGLRTECLWMNYAEPDVLHDFRFLGRDYRERERIKRKAQRWVSRLQSLPRLEKLAIYAEMASSIDGGHQGPIAEFDDAAGRIAFSGDGGRSQLASPELEVLQ